MQGMIFTPENSKLMQFIAKSEEEKQKQRIQMFKDIWQREEDVRRENEKKSLERKRQFQDTNVTLTLSEYIQFINNPNMSILDFPKFDLSLPEFKYKPPVQPLWKSERELIQFQKLNEEYDKSTSESRYGIVSDDEFEYEISEGFDYNDNDDH